MTIKERKQLTKGELAFSLYRHVETKSERFFWKNSGMGPSSDKQAGSALEELSQAVCFASIVGKKGHPDYVGRRLVHRGYHVRI